MDDVTLKAILSAKITNSLGFFGGRIGKERLKAMEYYNGEPYGNEQEGRSQVVSRDVAEVVDGMMPALIKIFSAGDQIVRFDPKGQEDEQGAEQATDYCNMVWQRNNGFAVMHDWFKDALLQRIGVIKIWWDESEDVNEEHYQGVTDLEMMILGSDPGVDIVEDIPYQDPMMGMLHNVSVKRKKKSGRVEIASVPPEEFLMERRAVSLEETPFCAHRFKRSASDLIEYGYEKSLIDSIPSDGESEYNMERIERFRQEDELPYRTDGQYDPSTREIWVTECYLKVDYNGDGIAEWRKITIGGETTFTILDNEPISDHPFAALTPIPMPHKFVGKSIADQSMDLQLIKSTLWRNALDNLYQSNNSRVVVIDGQVNLDDLLTVRPGGIVRAKSQGAVTPLVVPDISAGAMQMIEYTDNVKEKRTGWSQLNQGVDPNALDSTAAGINMMQEAGNQRLELIARVFAETGVKRAFKRILHLMTEYQTEPVTIRLRNQWVQMDPREWKTGYDVIVNVGLGTGDKRQQVSTMMQLLNIDHGLIQLQGGLAGPFVTAKNIYAKLKRLTEAAGHKDVDSFYNDPGNWAPQQQQQQPPVDLLKIQAQAQADEKQMMIKSQLDYQEAQREAQLEQVKQQLQAQQVAQQQELEAQRELHKQQLEAIADQRKQELEAQQVQAQTVFDKWKAELDAETKIRVAKISASGGIDDGPVSLDDERFNLLVQNIMGNLSTHQSQIQEAIQQHQAAIHQALNQPKTIERGADGKAVSISGRPIVRGQDGKIIGVQ